MPYDFGITSRQRLDDLHPDMRRVVERVMSYQLMDFSVIETVRTLDRQKDLVARGVSSTMKSKHLRQSTGYAHAVDLYPYPVNMAAVKRGDMVEVSRFGVLAGLMLRAAMEEGVPIRWGGDWDRDGQTLDHTFFDAPHFELI